MSGTGAGGEKTTPSFLSRILNWKQGLDLPNPGPFEHLHHVSLSQQFFEGGKADLAKGMSANFQVSHAFTMGSAVAPASYHFGAIYVAGKHLMHGLIDTNGIFQGKYHFNFTKNLAARFQAQVSGMPGQSMLQSELDYAGPDYSLNAKVINPDVASQTGIVTASYLQSLTKHLVVGAEVVGQKMNPKESLDTGVNIGMKYATADSTTTVNLQQFAALQASYFHKVSPHVELGTELQMLFVGPRSDALCTVAAKFDYKQALVRTQLDSTGKVALLYEEKIYPGFSLLMAGEIDHVKATSRFGLGINMES